MRYKIEFIIGTSLFGTLGVLRRLTPFPSGFITVFRLSSSAIVLMLLLMALRQKTDWQAIRANLKYLVLSALFLGEIMPPPQIIGAVMLIGSAIICQRE